MRVRFAKVVMLVALLVAAFFLPAGEAGARRKAGYSCPALGALNCMPKRNKALCRSNAYMSWARRNCPGFRTVR